MKLLHVLLKLRVETDIIPLLFAEQGQLSTKTYDRGPTGA